MWGSTVDAWKPQKLLSTWLGTEGNGPPGWSPEVTWEKSGQIGVAWWGQVLEAIEGKRSGFLSGTRSGDSEHGVIRRFISWEFGMIGTGSTGMRASC